MPVSSKKRAKDWPYPRYRPYSDMLKDAAATWFTSRNLHVRRKSRYILTKPNTWKDNIIVPEVVDLIEQIRLERKAQGKGFALHRYTYHGLSSQAMLFNLVGPLIVDNDQELLSNLFSSITSGWSEKTIEVAFEFEDRKVFNEDVGQPTSIDMVLRKNNGSIGAIVEFKFTETEFGGCSVFATGDCDGRNPSNDLKSCYLHFIGRKYWELLKKYGFFDGPLADGKICVLSTHYQFFRILLFALEYDVPMAFIWDDRNPTFYKSRPDGIRGLIPYLLTFVPQSVREKIILMTVKDIVEDIKESDRHQWIDDFEKKYAFTGSI